MKGLISYTHFMDPESTQHCSEVASPFFYSPSYKHKTGPNIFSIRPTLSTEFKVATCPVCFKT